MKLDKRIINDKRPLTCFDIEEAEKYIGKLCYMCDEYNLFYQLNLIEPAILMGVEDCEIPFHYGEDHQAEFCLPCEWITKEKKFRPYTFKEFKDIFTIGQPIKYRRKGNVGLENEIVLDGYAHEQRGDQIFTYIYIGVSDYTLQELFEDYEWQDPDTGEWNTFGVEE